MRRRMLVWIVLLCSLIMAPVAFGDDGFEIPPFPEWLAQTWANLVSLVVESDHGPMIEPNGVNHGPYIEPGGLGAGPGIESKGTAPDASAHDELGKPNDPEHGPMIEPSG